MGDAEITMFSKYYLLFATSKRAFCHLPFFTGLVFLQKKFKELLIYLQLSCVSQRGQLYMILESADFVVCYFVCDHSDIKLV